MSDKLDFSGLGYEAGVKECVDFLIEEKLRPNNLVDNSEVSGQAYSQSFERTKRHSKIARNLLILTSPAIFIGAIGTKLQDGGHVFYNSERVDEISAQGEVRSSILVPKIRSMKEDACSMPQPEFKVSSWEDPRVTKWGALIRTFSIDELTQLGMVVARQMSMVGPRGNTVYEHANFEHAIGDKYALTHRRAVNSRNMKGLTSLAVLGGSRAIESVEDMQMWVAAELVQDVYCSPELDSYVMLETPKHMLTENAGMNPLKDVQPEQPLVAVTDIQKNRKQKKAFRQITRAAFVNT